MLIQDVSELIEKTRNLKIQADRLLSKADEIAKQEKMMREEGIKLSKEARESETNILNFLSNYMNCKM